MPLGGSMLACLPGVLLFAGKFETKSSCWTLASMARKLGRQMWRCLLLIWMYYQIRWVLRSR
jgi:hypothetical protein